MKLTTLSLLATTALAQIPPPEEPTGDAVPRSRPFYPSPWMSGSGAWADAYAKAQALVGQMTLLEKVNITTGTGWQSYRCVGNVGSVPRLGLDELCMQDSPLGIRFTDYNSAFPAGGTVAAAWDKDVWYRRGYDMGSEFRDKGIDVALGPAIGPLGRMPAGGRNWEGFSPDPYLTGVAVAATVKGIQDAGVVATTKHFILNEQEHFRQVGESVGYGDNITDTLSSNIDDVTMHELYLWPFADAVHAGTGAIMCSYQQINNSYGCQNSYTLNHLLKNELGFQGFVMTDWQAHQSGVDSALAGVDMSMPGDTRFNTGDAFWGANLTIAVLNGSIPEWRLDDAATRIMAAWYFVGRDNPEKNPPTNFNSWTADTFGPNNFYADAGYGLTNEHVDVRQEHGAHIREYGAKSTVLLKNNGALPLTGKEKFTAVFGEDSTDSDLGPNGCPDRGCDNGTLAMGWGSGTASFPYLITPLEAIKSEVRQNNGVIQSVTDNYRLDLVQALARQASTALVFVNSDAGEGFINFDGNRGDRNNLTLWLDGNDLIRNVSANCNNTIVVVHSVGPVEMGEWYDSDNVTAILYAGLPGEQSGNAIADVLYGRYNPSGKLPFTMGAKREDWGVDVLYEPNNGELAPQQTFSEGVFIDYRHFDKENIEPIYPFGYGLSYTTFNYSNLVIRSANAGPYTPTQGQTQPAPVLGSEANSTDYSPYVYPEGFERLETFIYPYINSTDLEASSGDIFYGTEDYLPENAQNGNAQPLLPAGGAPGGNPQLWDVIYTITATVTNTGSVAGEEIAQLYISLGGENQPVRVLRGFEKASLQPGESRALDFPVLRRDLLNWDEPAQDWVDRGNDKMVWVGASSRDLPLSAPLQDGGAAPYPTGGSPTEGGPAPTGAVPYPTAQQPSEVPSYPTGAVPIVGGKF